MYNRIIIAKCIAIIFVSIISIILIDILIDTCDPVFIEVHINKKDYAICFLYMVALVCSIVASILSIIMFKVTTV